MIAIKGQAWLTQWGGTDSEHFITWCEACKDLSAEQIKQGFSRFMDSGNKFLDAQQFRKFCLNKTEHSTNWQAYRLLPRANRIEDKGKKDRSANARNKFINSIRSALA